MANSDIVYCKWGKKHWREYLVEKNAVNTKRIVFQVAIEHAE